MKHERSHIEAELAAAADGSLDAGRRERLLHEASASPELARQLERQQAALAALRALEVSAPDPLRRAVTERVETAVRPPRRRAWRPRVGTRAPRPRLLAAAGAACALLLALAIVTLSGGGAAAPSVAQAAPLALRGATAPAPPAQAGGRLLAADVDGVAYPTWDPIGWRAVGARSDTLNGHRIHTVFYADARGARVGYAIAAGDALPVTGGRSVERYGTWLRVLDVGGAHVVTWRRAGHTCILAGRGVGVERLLTLATYST